MRPQVMFCSLQHSDAYEGFAMLRARSRSYLKAARRQDGAGPYCIDVFATFTTCLRPTGVSGVFVSGVFA